MPLGFTFTLSALASALLLFPIALVLVIGLPGFEVDSWYGILAPANTPRVIIDRLDKELLAIVQADDFRQRLVEQGAAPVGNTPEQFANYIQNELAKWGKVIKAANVRPE